MKPCKMHLRGNAQCPNSALYVVTHVPHTKVGVPKKISRSVCGHHFAAAVEDALADQAADDPCVDVRLAGELL